MRYPLCDDSWDDNELSAIQEVIRSRRFTMGEKVHQYEKKFAEMFGSRFALMVNSGSSANLIAIAALVYAKRIQPGDEVIVPAVSWSTTYTPLVQFGLKLIFIDIDPDTLNVDLKALESAINNKTKLFFAVNLLGNPNRFDEIQKLCDEHHIMFIEDNCESMGARYQGKDAGTFGLIGTFSSFYSHHISTMEGGTVVTDDEELYHYMLAIRAHGWTRNLPDKSIIYEKGTDPFYESYNFIVPGFNLRPLEMEAAIGLVQLDKLPKMVERRRENAQYLRDKMKYYPEFRLQAEIGESSWFGFSIVMQGSLMGKRDKIVNAFIREGIEVRPIVAGNFTRNKVMEYLNYEIPFPLIAADEIHENGFFIGNNGKRMTSEIDYLLQVLESVLNKEV